MNEEAVNRENRNGLVIEMLVFQEENEETVNILHPLIPYVSPVSGCETLKRSRCEI